MTAVALAGESSTFRYAAALVGRSDVESICFRCGMRYTTTAHEQAERLVLGMRPAVPRTCPQC